MSLQEGHLLADAGRSADAIVAYDRALNTASVEEEIAAAKLGKAGALRLLDRNAEALALLAEAEPALLAKSRIADLALLEHLRGNLLFPLGQTAACQTAHEKALDYAERCGSVELKARALGGLGDAAYANGRVNTARRLFAECVELARQHGFGRIEVANAPMLASLSADAKTVLLEIGRAIDAAAKARQPRAELTGHLIAMSWLLCSGRPTAIKSHFDRAQEIILQIGSRRLSAMNVTIMGEAHRQLGDRERAVAMHEEALAIAREIGMSYVGGIILAFRALATHDTLDMRRASLREGERVVSEGSVSTTTLFFYCFAIESCLLAEDWGEARRLADRLIMSFALEQPPIVAFVTERCRLLADAAEKGLDQALRRSSEKCRDNGRALGFGLFLGLLDQCLD